MRQPDIEIYLKDEDVDHKAIAQWLGDALGSCSEWKQKGQTEMHSGHCRRDLAAQSGRQMEQPASGQRSDPVEDDIACARAAFKALNVEVRCAPGTWVEEESDETADRWIRVSADGEEEITWRTS